MSTDDGLFVISYNGEIYNFEEIRRELQRLGHTIKSRTDTEVVLHAYAQWGRACVEKFNGMFAFAILDYKRQRIFLARDRYGIKPLYYTFCGGKLLFASEAKAFLTYPDFTPRLDFQALTEYFTFQNILSDHTFLSNVHILPAGCHAYTSLHGDQTLHLRRYWDYDFNEDPALSDERGCEEELDRLFRQAIQRQLVSDVEIGSYLSGGMDSGSIAALAAQKFPYLKTFTCGFDLHSASGLELGFDERSTAEYMSYIFKTEHYEMVLKAGDMERVLPQVAWHIEEPRVGQSYPNYCIANLASRFVKVALAGTGGDELFGGYPWRYYRGLGAKSFEDYIDKYYLYWQRLVPNTTLRALLAPIKNETQNIWTRDIFRNVFANTDVPQTPENSINHSLYFEAKTFLHGLLVVDDKLSMAHSLETRVPFLDNDLVDFAMHLPVRFKLAKLDEVVRINENENNKLKTYYLKTNDGKAILRKTMQRYIPQEITQAMKQGFSAPDATWFKGESMQYVQKRLFNNDARIFGYLDKKTVQSLVAEHLSGKQNRRLLIWSLLNFEAWLKGFLP
ncbi:MAG: Asparagine synthetase [glutamine-hydrolyzing] 1 [Desulfovibrio sp.]